MNAAQRIAAHQKRMNLIGRNPVFHAIAKLPMKQETQSTQAIDARLSFRAISLGQGDHYDRKTMDSLTSLVLNLANKHCSEDDRLMAWDAKQAVKRAQERFESGKSWNFDADGRAAVMKAMDMFEQMAERLGRAEVTMALIEIINGQGVMQ